MFFPFCLYRYLCQVKDSHLRAVANRNMFEFMWTAVKDPLDAHATFDKEGLDLAFKYFNSTTLTMRLAGISQINVIHFLLFYLMYKYTYFKFYFIT